VATGRRLAHQPTRWVENDKTRSRSPTDPAARPVASTMKVPRPQYRQLSDLPSQPRRWSSRAGRSTSAPPAAVNHFGVQSLVEDRAV